MPHIFISYAKKDTRSLAEALYEALNAHPDLSAWMDMSLEADSSWAFQIQQEIDRADYVVVLLSPDVNRIPSATQRRSFVLNEMDYAQQDNKPILPVMAQHTKMPVQIAGVQYIDLTQNPDDPTRVVERVCRRFHLPTPTELRQREAEEQARRQREAEEKLRREIVIQRLQVSGYDNIKNEIPNDEDQQLVKSDSGKKAPGSTAEKSPTVNTSRKKATIVTATFVLFSVIVSIFLLPMVVNNSPSILSLPTTTHTDVPTATHTDVPTATHTDVPTATHTDVPTATHTDVPTATHTDAPIATHTSESALTPTSTTPIGNPFSRLVATISPTPFVVRTNEEWQPLESYVQGIRMVMVPGGCFDMGINNDGGEQCFDAFLMSEYEITNSEYAEFVEADGYDNQAYWTEAGWQAKLNNGWTQPAFWEEGSLNGADQPVVGVSWYEAMAFATWYGGSLPTEAQWEYAARGPDGLLYPWGDDFIPDNIVYERNSGGVTTRVSSHTQGRSWVGAHHMMGNAGEWTLSIWLSYPYRLGDGRESVEGDNARIARGAPYYRDLTAADATTRIAYSPTHRAFGFRIVRDY